MKIGMILDGPFPPDPRVENEALTLIGLGHEVFLYCFDFHHDQPRKEHYKGIEIRRHKVPFYIKKLSALAYTLPVYHRMLKKSIHKFVIHNGIKTLHVHDIQIARAVFYIKRKLPQLTIILDLHENRPEIMKHYRHVITFPGKVLIYPEIWKRFEYKYIRKADKLIVVTEEAKKYYIENVPVHQEKIFVVPNYVRKEFYTKFELNKDIIEKYNNHFVLLYLGDTGERRGIATMIDAVEILAPKITNIKLILVGKSKDDEKWKKLIESKKLEKHVDQEGWQDFGLFPSYIQSSNIGLCPIHKNIHHETTYANKLFQSIAFGRPIIVSNCAAQKHLVENHGCGLVFEDQSAIDLAEKIELLHKEKELYKKMAKNGEKAVREELNWNNIAKTLATMYESS